MLLLLFPPLSIIFIFVSISLSCLHSVHSFIAPNLFTPRILLSSHSPLSSRCTSTTSFTLSPSLTHANIKQQSRLKLAKKSVFTNSNDEEDADDDSDLTTSNFDDFDNVDYDEFDDKSDISNAAYDDEINELDHHIPNPPPTSTSGFTINTLELNKLKQKQQPSQTTKAPKKPPPSQLTSSSPITAYKQPRPHISSNTIPLIAIIGRPNVGKSALVNRLAGTQTGGAIVADVSGITRDRTYREGEFMNKRYRVVDTGGLVFDDKEGIFIKDIREQALIAINEASAIVVVTDGQIGLTPMDLQISQFLRKDVIKKGIPIHLAVNKCESQKLGITQAAEFWKMGLGKPFPVSAIHGVGTAELLEAAYEKIFPVEEVDEQLKEDVEFLKSYNLKPSDFGLKDDGTKSNAYDVVKPSSSFVDNEDTDEEAAENTINIAIIGRPNVGKSSLLNTLFGSQRAIVSNVAGTTRDSIDCTMIKEAANPNESDVVYKFIDTAGVRKRGKVEFGPEFFMVNRALRAIGRADVVLLVLDATAGVAEQDRKLAQKIADDGRACIIICNKWDAVVDKDQNTYDNSVKYFREELPQVKWAPILFTSATSGQRVNKIYAKVDEAVTAHRKRYPTAILNEVLRDAVLWQPPPARRNGKQAKIYYCNQVATRPPTVVVFTNDAALVNDNYKRYLDRKFRESLPGFESTPIRWVFRGRRVRDLSRAGAGAGNMNGKPGDGGSGRAFPHPHAG